MKTIVGPLWVLLFVLGGVAAAQEARPSSSDDVEGLRRELQALREEYARRLAEIEARIETLSPAAPPSPAPPTAPAPAPAPVEAAVPAGAAGAGGPTGALPVYGVPTSKIFNPDIAVIGDFRGAMGGNPAPDAPSRLDMHEAEASFQAVVDPYARADFFFAFEEEGLDLEEGYVTFPTLPGGFLLKAGKMRASFGKVNTLHNHVVPWADRPLVTGSLVGGEEGISDAGLSLSHLIPNPALFLEATAEVYRGENEAFTAPGRSDFTYVGRLRAYRDVTESANLDLGASFASGVNDTGRRTRLLGVDLTFRQRPLRRAIYRRFLGRTELVWSRREEENGRRDAFGAFVSGEYQFARRWFAGARWDYAERPDAPALADKGGSVILTFWPSEFSQVRAQYRHTRFGEGTRANELLFQAVFSIGAHGAHVF